MAAVMREERGEREWAREWRRVVKKEVASVGACLLMLKTEVRSIVVELLSIVRNVVVL